MKNITVLFFKNSKKIKHIWDMQSIVNCIVRLYLVHTYINRRFGNYMQVSLIAKFLSFSCVTDILWTLWVQKQNKYQKDLMNDHWVTSLSDINFWLYKWKCPIICLKTNMPRSLVFLHFLRSFVILNIGCHLDKILNPWGNNIL